MFISKLRPDDSVGMVTFNDSTNVIFTPTLKKEIGSDIFERLDQIQASGGTALTNGFNLSKTLLLKQMAKQKGKNYENRIIIISDVEDNSVTQSVKLIQRAAVKENVHLSIVGISADFNSQTCEALKDTKGFNYFCAVDIDDILKYLFETFDYAFFPSASNLKITLESDGLRSIEVFGTPDADKLYPEKK